MTPRRIGHALGRGAQLVWNLMCVLMVFGGLYLMVAGDKDEALDGAAYTFLGTVLFSPPASAPSDDVTAGPAEPDETE